MSICPRISHRRGMTLIEIMVVIGIIVILAGLVVAVGGSVRTKAKIKREEAQLTALYGIMKDYEANNGPMPAASLSDATSDWVKILDVNPGTKGPIEKQEITIDTAGKPHILDAWGQAVTWTPATATGPGFFTSAGPDGVAGNGDDLTSK